MDNLTAKRVFTALAKSLSCSSVQRCKNGPYYKLRLLSPSGNVCAVLGVQTDAGWWWAEVLFFKSSKWAEMLKELEGKTIAVGSERIKINSIEELIVDLELQGFLKKI